MEKFTIIYEMVEVVNNQVIKSYGFEFDKKTAERKLKLLAFNGYIETIGWDYLTDYLTASAYKKLYKYNNIYWGIIEHRVYKQTY